MTGGGRRNRFGSPAGLPALNHDNAPAWCKDAQRFRDTDGALDVSHRAQQILRAVDDHEIERGIVERELLEVGALDVDEHAGIFRAAARARLHGLARHRDCRATTQSNL